MESTLTASVKIKTKHMYSFLLHFCYSSIKDWFGVFLSIIALVVLVVRFEQLDDMGKIILLLIGLLFTIINPVMLYFKAKKQILLNPIFKNEIVYQFNEEGIEVCQGETTAAVAWEQIFKVIVTRKLLLIYTSKIHASILPLDQIEQEKILPYIEKHVPKEKRKAKQWS